MTVNADRRYGTPAAHLAKALNQCSIPEYGYILAAPSPAPLGGAIAPPYNISHFSGVRQRKGSGGLEWVVRGGVRCLGGGREQKERSALRYSVSARGPRVRLNKMAARRNAKWRLRRPCRVPPPLPASFPPARPRQVFISHLRSPTGFDRFPTLSHATAPGFDGFSTLFHPPGNIRI